MSTIPESTIDGEWVNVELPDDGDDANQPTFEEGYQHLVDRDQFLMRNAAIAIANVDFSNSATGSERYRGVCFGSGAGPGNHGMLVACGKHNTSQAVYSLSVRDGEWADYTTSGDPFTTFGADFYGVAHGTAGAYGSRKFVFVGQQRLVAICPAIWIVDDDAEEDDNVSIPKFGAFTSVLVVGANVGDALRAVTWTGSVFCAVGDSGLIYTSPDGETWTARTPDESYTGSFRAIIALSSTMLLAVGDDGEVQRSTNSGVTWTRVFSNDFYGTLTSIARSGDSILIGTSETNIVLRSTDNGASYDEIEIAPTSGSFDPQGKFVFAFRGLLGVRVVHGNEEDGTSFVFLSYDGGATWPVVFHGATASHASVAGAVQHDRLTLVGMRSAGAAGSAAVALAYLWQTPILPQSVADI